MSYFLGADVALIFAAAHEIGNHDPDPKFALMGLHNNAICTAIGVSLRGVTTATNLQFNEKSIEAIVIEGIRNGAFQTTA